MYLFKSYRIHNYPFCHSNSVKELMKIANMQYHQHSIFLLFWLMWSSYAHASIVHSVLSTSCVPNLKNNISEIRCTRTCRSILDDDAWTGYCLPEEKKCRCDKKLGLRNNKILPSKKMRESTFSNENGTYIFPQIKKKKMID